MAAQVLWRGDVPSHCLQLNDQLHAPVTLLSLKYIPVQITYVNELPRLPIRTRLR
jgi:hypothetical protein